MARVGIDVQQKPERISKMLSRDLSLVFESMVAVWPFRRHLIPWSFRQSSFKSGT